MKRNAVVDKRRRRRRSNKTENMKGERNQFAFSEKKGRKHEEHHGREKIGGDTESVPSAWTLMKGAHNSKCHKSLTPFSAPSFGLRRSTLSGEGAYIFRLYLGMISAL